MSPLEKFYENQLLLINKLQRKNAIFDFFKWAQFGNNKKEVALLKAVDSFRYILSFFRSHHLMAGQTEFLLVDAFRDGQGKPVP